MKEFTKFVLAHPLAIPLLTWLIYVIIAFIKDWRKDRIFDEAVKRKVSLPREEYLRGVWDSGFSGQWLWDSHTPTLDEFKKAYVWREDTPFDLSLLVGSLDIEPRM